MPVFECAKCNELTYSASAESASPCARCGSERHRVLEGTFEAVRSAPRALAPGDHITHVYVDPAEIAPFCARYLGDGVRNNERVMAGVPDDLRELVEPLVARDVRDQVVWRDSREIYCNFDAERIATMYETLIVGEPLDMRILGVIDEVCVDGVDAAELARYEALAHQIITVHGATVICMYDCRSLDGEYLAAVARAHTLCVDDDEVIRRNEAFEYQSV